MNRKYTYPILVCLFMLGFLYFEKCVNTKLDQPLYDEGARVKSTTRIDFLPTSTTGDVVHHNYYSLSYSETDEQAEWVAYELKKNHLSRNDFKRPYFEIDKAVRTKAAHWRNYKNSGYDRGHLCPAGDRRFSKEAYDETFLTSNVSPQEHDFNGGIWNSLEQKIRFWAEKYDGVFVVTGGILSNKTKTIGEEHITVPDSFYKIIYDRKPNGDIEMIAFLMPHQASTEPLYSFVTSVDTIEKLTGIDFFPSLEDTLENTLEASKSYKAWSFR